MKTSEEQVVTFSSRGVRRRVEPGEGSTCASCGQAIRFSMKAPTHQIIANVYENGVWNRVEHFHDTCYLSAGLPYGKARE
ncbi:hypothetical protein SAMN02745225_00475 [Ferrithrix thermotolerans DSM 19514]|uniref:PARP-type domain-containing protein n=1 Tax=Ferrithrix thermotolerans DSM 19514 TaxID=1121881 RepID=A0A1M4T347_9ACTN|nr:hypothetical protein [Ferrithrix thermotolerans]SHE38861.1 hypothetical protein SAMN02745225_00475 [Ferrithrix thermotolerans DSM 19514]